MGTACWQASVAQGRWQEALAASPQLLQKKHQARSSLRPSGELEVTNPSWRPGVQEAGSRNCRAAPFPSSCGTRCRHPRSGFSFRQSQPRCFGSRL